MPQKKGRNTRIEQLSKLDNTFIVYESPFRLLKTLEQFRDACGGERKASVTREISKLHEETLRGSLSELIAHFTEIPPKGEIVICISGRTEDDSNSSSIEAPMQNEEEKPRKKSKYQLKMERLEHE